MNLIDGKSIANTIYDTLKEKISQRNEKPKLVAILVWDSAASLRYIKQKQKWANHIGMSFQLKQFAEEISESQLIDVITQTNQDASIHGYIVQLPLPKHINSQKIIDSIDPKKDVDGFHPYNQGKVMIGDPSGFVPCTPAGIMEIFQHHSIHLSGKLVCVLGRSNIVGKPITSLLINAGATVISCNSKTQNLAQLTKQADIIILAIWQAQFLKKDMIKKWVIIIDVGFTIQDNIIYGDADFENIKNRSQLITPVPGWVWAMTVAMLLKNTFQAFLNQNK